MSDVQCTITPVEELREEDHKQTEEEEDLLAQSNAEQELEQEEEHHEPQKQLKDTIENEIDQLPDLQELLEEEAAAENDDESFAPNVVLSDGELVSIRDLQSA